MLTMQTELGTNSLELAKQAFEAFCTDISGMFGVQLNCKWKETVCETTEGLKNRFQTLTAITTINAEGAMNGKFHLIFDKKGLFTLGGVVLMPEAMTNLLEKCVGPQKIINNIKNGTLKEAQEISDAVSEACNLLVGSWDRIFRENLNGHGHFTQADFFIGNPWDNAQEKFGLTKETKCVLVSFDMKIAQYPPFMCAAIFTQDIIGPINTEQQQQQEEQPEPKAEDQPQTEEQTEPQDQQQDQPQQQEEQPEPKAEDQPQTEEQTEPQDQQQDQPQQQEEQPEPKAEDQPQTEEQTEPQDQQQNQEQNETQDKEQTDHATENIDQEGPTIVVSQQQISDSIKNMANSSAVLPGDLSHVSLSMTAKEIMQTNVQWINPDDSVQTAINKMQQNDTGYLLVGNDGELQGIISNSNIASALSPYLKPIFSKWRGPMDDATLNIKVKWIMSRPVRVVNPQTSLKVMIECMQQFGGRCLPVVEPQNKLLGMVTVFDIFKVLTSSENVSKKGKSPQAPPLV